METVGQRIKKVREELGLNPRQFAISANINTSNYYKVEAGKLGVKTNSLQAIATQHGVNMGWLLTGEGEMFNKEAVPANLPDTKAHIPTDEGAELKKSSLEEAVILELIESSKAQRSMGETMKTLVESVTRISDALLDERQMLRSTAQAAIDLAKAAGPVKDIKHLSTTVGHIEQAVEDDHVSLVATQSLLAELGAEIRGVQKDSVLAELGKKILAETQKRDIAQKARKASKVLPS